MMNINESAMEVLMNVADATGYEFVTKNDIKGGEDGPEWAVQTRFEKNEDGSYYFKLFNVVRTFCNTDIVKMDKNEFVFFTGTYGGELVSVKFEEKNLYIVVMHSGSGKHNCKMFKFDEELSGIAKASYDEFFELEWKSAMVEIETIGKTMRVKSWDGDSLVVDNNTTDDYEGWRTIVKFKHDVVEKCKYIA